VNRDDLRKVLFEELRRLAPEADLASLAPKALIRDELDLDSYDFGRLITAVDQRLGIEIPEGDYARVETLDGWYRYLEEKRAKV